MLSIETEYITCRLYSKGNRDLALRYENNRRKIDPALYNHHRLNEKPFPARQARQAKQIVSKRMISNESGKKQSTVHTIAPTELTPPNSPIPFLDIEDDIEIDVSQRNWFFAII